MTVISPVFASKENLNPKSVKESTLDTGLGYDQVNSDSIPNDTSNFDGALSPSDDTPQKAFDTLDDKVAAESLWDRSGTDITPQYAGDNVNIGTGGLKDNDVTTPIPLGDASNTALNTTAQSLAGGINEVFANIPTAVEDLLTITGDGQTAFTLSSAPSGDAAFTLFLNGQLQKLGTDYSRSGTSLTWLDPAIPGGNLTLKTTDILLARYNDTALSGGGNQSLFINADYNNTVGSRRTKEIAANGDSEISFAVPPEAVSILSAKLIGIPSVGAAGSGKDIDVSSEYSALDESRTTHIESDTTSTYDFTGKANQTITIKDLISILTNVTGGDFVGVSINHNSIGGAIDYLGVRLTYSV